MRRFLLFALLGLSVSQAFPEEALDVFVLVGTSNMEGVAAPVSELPDELRKPRTDVVVFAKGGWLPLEPGVAPHKPKGVFGPEVSLGPLLSQHLGKPLGLIQTTMRAVSDAQGYRRTVAVVKEARKTRPIRIRGLVVQAGERDGADQERVDAFEANLISLMENARRDFENPTLPVVINLAIPKPDQWPHVMEIREIEKRMKLPGLKVVDCDTVSQAADGIHYNAAGELEFGRRLAEGLIELSPVAAP